MEKVRISKALKEICKEGGLGIINAKIEVKESDVIFNNKFQKLIKEISENLKIEEISQIESIKKGRMVYKKFGKDPARYRLSSEALLRRILKDQEVYLVNNMVDIGNYISVKEKLVVCVYDKDKIDGNIEFKVANEEYEYDSIGRGVLNIKGIPSFFDNIGPFGTTTSDSKRTSVTQETKEIIAFVVDFSGTYNLDIILNEYEKLISDDMVSKNLTKEILRF